MNIITEQENFSGPGIGVETEPNYANAVKKGYFIPSTGKWNREKMEKDGVVKKVEPKKEVPVEPETTTPVGVPVTLTLPPLSFIVVASIPVNCDPSPRYDVAVMIPAFPSLILLPTFKLATFVCKDVAVTIPVTVIPFGKSGAPSPTLFFILSARIIDMLY